MSQKKALKCWRKLIDKVSRTNQLSYKIVFKINDFDLKSNKIYEEEILGLEYFEDLSPLV